MNSLSIAVVAASFPTKESPAEGVYLFNLLRQFSLGNDVRIYAPKRFFGRARSYTEMEEFSSVVRRPVYFNLKWLSQKSQLLDSISMRSYHRSVERNLVSDFDVIYSHFLYPSGYVANKISIKSGKPYFIALGESTFDSYMSERSHKILKQASGLIVVSDKIKNFLISNVGISVSKILVAPNRADSGVFKPFDKLAARRRLNFPEQSKIIIFVGQFINRKGHERVLQALELLPYKVHAIFIGKGEITSNSDKIIYKGTIENKYLVDYYNSADIFVLPTLSEGSCNAVAEAIACGLPIVSSNIEEISEQVFTESAVLVDPTDPAKIANGIDQVYSKYDSIKEKAMQSATTYNLKSRSEAILSFIESTL